MNRRNPILIAATFVLLVAPPQRAGAVEVAFESDGSAPLVYLNVAVKTGSVSDPEGKKGLTHFLGEMLLRGTKSKNKNQIDLRLDELGASLEVSTLPESLTLRGAVLSRNLDGFLDLLTEILTKPAFPKSEIRKLKSEVISEILSNLSEDSYLVAKFFQKGLFEGHPYQYPRLGLRSHVDGFSREDVLGHFKRLFRDGNLLVLGTGDAQEGRISEWAHYLGRLRPGDANTPTLATPTGTSTRMLFVDKPERTQSWILIGQIGVHGTNPDYFPLYVGNYAFGGTFSSRLMQEIRVKRGWSYGASSGLEFGSVPRSWQVQLFPASKYADQALAKAIEMIEKLKKDGITREEFEFAQTSLINSDGFRYDTPRKRVENRLLERTLGLPDGFYRSYADHIHAATLDQVNAALKKTLHDPSGLFITMVGTASTLKSRAARAAGIPEDQVKTLEYSNG